MNCILCGSVSYKGLVNMNLYQLLRRFLHNHRNTYIVEGHKSLKYVYCLGCGLIYQKFPPSDECLSKFYKTWRSDMDLEGFKKYTERKLSANEKKINWMEQGTDLSLLKGKMLDVGTADGSMCELFQRKGWISYGVEQTQEMVEYSKKFYKNIKIVDSAYEKQLFPPKHFDLILYGQSLEHFRDPFKAIEMSSSHLKQDGYLYIEVPTFMSSSFREFISQHFFIFTKNSLSKILIKQGYTIRKMDILYDKSDEQPDLAVLCQRNNKGNLSASILEADYKKEYKRFKQIVLYRYIYALTFRPFINLIKKSLSLI